MKKILIVGCGAITQQHHIPALEKLGCKIYLSDLNPEVVLKQNAKFPFSNDYKDFIDVIDGALIATNHSSHFFISETILKSGKHVLVEKPITINTIDCEKLITFEKNNIVGAGYFRRYIENFIILKNIIKEETFGKIKKIEINEGGVYSWPAMSNSFWKKDSAGGGVLIDTGSHSIDLLFFLLNEEINLISYFDDSIDGIEANSEINLKTKSNISINVALSRTRPTKNEIFLEFEDAKISLNVANGSLNNIISEKNFNSFTEMEYPDDIFIKQVKYWTNSFELSENQLVKASDALKTVKLIEECYENKERLIKW